MKRPGPAKMPPQDPITKRFLKSTPVIPTVVAPVVPGAREHDGVLNQSPDASASGDTTLETTPPVLETTVPETRAVTAPKNSLANSARVQDGLDPLTIELTDGLPVAPPAPNVDAPATLVPAAPKKKTSGLLVGLGLLVASAAVVGIVVLSGGRAGSLAPRLPVDGIQ